MTCPYGCKFDACICVMRHNSAVSRMRNPEAYDGDERSDYYACYNCNAVKCFIKYRSRFFKKQEDELKSEQEILLKNPHAIRDKYGRTIIAFGKNNRSKQVGE